MISQTDDEIFYHLAVLQTPQIGHANAKFLLSHFPNIREVFSAPKSRLAKVPGIGDKAVQAIISKSGLDIAENIIKDCQKKGIKIIHYLSSDYPSKLKQVLDAPYVFYYQGDKIHNDRSVAIVGTRDATNYGKSMTARIVEELVPYQTMIVSGLAYGIDIEAHRAALQYQLPTIGVLAGGLDRIYPSTHTKTVDKMIDQGGGILSEQPPGTKPDAHLFPARNRIIAALSDATIVVEAKQKGGALITASVADSYDRPVFAVPGNLDHPHSEGCNHLIRNQKALIYTSAKDLVYYLNWDQESTENKNKKVVLPELTQEEEKVYQLLSGITEGVNIDELSWKSGIPINQIASVLLSMEFKGIVKALPGKKFKSTN